MVGEGTALVKFANLASAPLSEGLRKQASSYLMKAIHNSEYPSVAVI